MAISEPRTYNRTKTVTPKTATQSKVSTKEIKLSKSTEGDGASPLKVLYEKTFQTTTLTLGCLTGCLRRATDLGDNAKDVAGCLETAADVLTTTRITTYQCIEYLVASNLLAVQAPVHQDNPLGPQIEASADQQAHSLQIEPSSQDESTETEVIVDQQQPLDLLLDRQHGETIVRNVIALVLNGRIDGRGRKATHPEAVQAREVAQSVYDDMKRLYRDQTSEDWVPTNSSAKLHLSIPQGELAHEIHTAIRTHFARLPGVIVAKVHYRFSFVTVYSFYFF